MNSLPDSDNQKAETTTPFSNPSEFTSPPSDPIQINATTASKISFATHQNSVALIKELSLENTSEQTFENLRLSITSNPQVIEERNWYIERLEPGAIHHINDRSVSLDADILEELIERISTDLIFSISTMSEDNTPQEPISQKISDLNLLPKNHWGGDSMSELLAAYCMPNDPACAPILKSACRILKNSGKNPSISGYSGNSSSRIWEYCSAIWSAVIGLELNYISSPPSFEEEGQKIRSASEIKRAGLGNCLDTTMLFASLLEQAKLNPILIIVWGHAYVGVWLKPENFNQLVIEDPTSLRKRIELQEIIVFETTMVTNSPPKSFSDAIKSATEQLENDRVFCYAIDIRSARKRKIIPLTFSRSPETVTTGESKESPSEVLEEAPLLPEFTVDIQTADDSGTDKVTQWQQKLLDLTARNRLLNLPPNSKHVPLLCSDIAALEDTISDGKVFKILSIPDLEIGGRDAELYQQNHNESLSDDFLNESSDRNLIYSSLTKKKLETNLIDLYRKSRSDIAEGGANTLFLALGFLHWKKSPTNPRAYNAPLILVPVTLKRKSARSAITLSAHEDETIFNMTLLELLKQDFGLNISGLNDELPQDDYGVDVTGIWNYIKLLVKDIPGFEVKENCALANFSFAKYLMWKDLVDRQDDLMVNPVVKQLLESEGNSYEHKFHFPKPEELDDTIDPSKLFVPLPADSSQIAAIVASTSNCNFVLDGPPGTGKSQTIANIIIHNLAQGKRVLFVAEKMAALEVVHRRLQEKGLGQFCLEVHSNKTSKQAILHQLDDAWSSKFNLADEQWNDQTSKLKELRNTLNQLCSILHKKYANGLTIHFAIGQVVKHHHSTTVKLKWTQREHTQSDYQKLTDSVKKLSQHADIIGHSPEQFSHILTDDWSNAWQSQLISLSSLLSEQLDQIPSLLSALEKQSGFDLSITSIKEISPLINLNKAILGAHEHDLSFAYTPVQKDLTPLLEQLKNILSSYQQSKAKLSTSYTDDVIKNIDINGFERRWNQAIEKFFIFKFIECRKIKKEYTQTVGAPDLPNMLQDIPHLRKLKANLDELASITKDLTTIPGFDGLNSNTDDMLHVITIADKLSDTIVAYADSPARLQTIKPKVKNIVLDTNELLAPGGHFQAAFTKLEDHHNQLLTTLTEFENLISNQEVKEAPFTLIQEICESIQHNEPKLRNWSNWLKVKNEAIELDLIPVIEQLEEKHTHPEHISQEFLTAYCQWFAAQEIDNHAMLRTFTSAQHSNTIDQFRAIDEKVAQLTVEYTKEVLTSQFPSRSSIDKKSGYGILKHELQKKRMHKPLRQLALEMGDAFTALAPCMLMSPLSIAQYLPPNQQLFDLVIFDEASQITPWDAVGSIARGKQVIIAGDPKQMPPTNFFQKGSNPNEFDLNTIEDLESVLDECLAVGIPRHSLNWHYRSRHESLIAFSNHRYYDSKLITFPSAVTKNSTVSRYHINGIYSRGEYRHNIIEAQAVVKKTVELLKENKAYSLTKTLGIITLNTEQQRLIENLLDAARRRNPEIEIYFSDKITEPVIVKNLETVQGDERDIILLSIGYGPSEPDAEKMSMNFGPLNREGGERRLNVAITRARHEMMVFSSFPPSMIDLNRTGAKAVRDLKHFLEFAEKGPQTLGTTIKNSAGKHDSPFEEFVTSSLRDKGWEIVPQIGVSKFRIDLGIVHPDHPDHYLAGVECDGAAYNSSATARDRDKVRSLVLEGLGWKLIRVWSTDWFNDPQRELEKLHTELQKIYKERQITDSEAEKKAREIDARIQKTKAEKQKLEIDQTIKIAELRALLEEVEQLQNKEQTSAQPSTQLDPSKILTQQYKQTDFTEIDEKITPRLFYSQKYDDTLEKLVEHTLITEAPIAEDLLVRRIARAHGFSRNSRKIKDRVLTIVDQSYHTQEDPLGSKFIWLNSSDPENFVTIREGKSDRKMEEITYLEIKLFLIKGDSKANISSMTEDYNIERITVYTNNLLKRSIISLSR